MKTTEIMKIEYSEPVVRVKEVTRRRCVVASGNEVNDSLQDYDVLDGNGDAKQSDDFGW